MIRRPWRAVLAGAAIAAIAVVVALLVVPMHPEQGYLRAVADLLPGRRLDPGSVTWWLAESVGNVALFVPVGLILGLLLRPRRALLLAVLVSAAAETAQIWIPLRHASLTDVVLNSIGSGAGVVIAALARRLVGRLRRGATPQASATRPHSVQAQ